MKTKLKTATLSLCAFATIGIISTCAAQGTLQFNRVISQQIVNNSGISVNYTVPIGKVFKLEGIIANADCNIYLNSNFFLKVNGPTNTGNSNQVPGSSYTASFSWPFPLWFKAGDIISATGGLNDHINGIEFNIIP